MFFWLQSLSKKPAHTWEKCTGPARENRQNCPGLPTVAAFLARVPPCSGYLLRPAGSLLFASHPFIHRPFTQHLPCVGHLPGAKDKNQRWTIGRSKSSVPLCILPPVQKPFMVSQWTKAQLPSVALTTLDGLLQSPQVTSLPVSPYMYEHNTSHSQLFRQVLSVTQVFPFHLDYSLCLFLPFKILWERQCL